MSVRYCIVFAGPVGSSKTPIAQYLSQVFGLPIFSNDSIRTEVKEDAGYFDIPEYDRRQKERFAAMLARGRSFIYDASVDRTWAEAERELRAAGFATFLISLDLSAALLRRLFAAKDYDQSIIEGYHADHEAFLKQHGRRANLHIADSDFPGRLQLAANALEQWLTEEDV